MSSEVLGRVRSRLTFWAETDPHVSGAALTGSLADGHADPWSDLDLVLGLRTFPEQVALACLRLNLPTDYAKGAHLLPADVTAALEPSLVHDLSTDEVLRALSTLVPLFLDELWLSDPDTAERLKPTLTRWARR